MVKSGETKLIEWLTGRSELAKGSAVALGIGDDMAIVNVPAGGVLLTADMLLDGVHFDRGVHDLEAVGRKAIGCSLSDCAAMGVQPVAATVSLALPADWRMEDSQRLYGGMAAMAKAFNCAIVGGDTTGWNQRLVIDVAMVATPYPGLTPVRRDGAGVGDVLLVTGPLGGSRLGRHLTFTPRVREAKRILEAWGDRLHAMMDISDGLSLDLHRMCDASGVGAALDERLLEGVIHPDARAAAQRDRKTPMQHALADGEDFELLLAVDGQVATERVGGVAFHRIGQITETGLTLRCAGGGQIPIEPEGFEHLS